MSNEEQKENEEWERAVVGGKAGAKKYKEPAVIMESDVLHEYEYKYDWILERTASIFYSKIHKQFWKMRARIYPDGSIEEVSDE